VAFRLNTYERELVKPMKKPLTAPLDLALSDSDVSKLRAGFRPRSQDDKWAWLIERGDDSNVISVHVIRHFVHEEVYVLHIALESSNSSNGKSARIRSITWEGEWNGVRNDVGPAKRNVVVLARSILGCDFETLPRYASGSV